MGLGNQSNPFNHHESKIGTLLRPPEERSSGHGESSRGGGTLFGVSDRALEVRGKEALAKCEAKREEATEAGERIKHFIEETKNMAVTKYEDWKTDREIDKIENHADNAEQQAVDAILLAAYAILKAEVAMVEALKARKIAIEVAG